MPTRGRPKLAYRFLQSVARTSKFLQHIEVIIYVDEDDVESHQIGHQDIDTHLIIGPRKSMGEYNSECLENSKGEIIILVNDDMIIQTQNWDEYIRQYDASVDDGIYLAYGNDLFKKNNLCTFPILSRKTCQILQKPYHPAYRGAFIDYHLMDIFKRLEHAGYQRISYLDGVVFEHLHYRTGKAIMDETYKARGRFDDDMIFVSLVNVRRESVLLLINALNQNNNYQETLSDYHELDKPGNLWAAIKLFTSLFLNDKGLPFKWRFFLWWWFGARYIASKVL